MQNKMDFNGIEKVLITGGAGFIGFHLAKRLLAGGLTVIGFDNMNNYYDVDLKEDRIDLLMRYDNFELIRGDIADKTALKQIFERYKPDIVINLAAQAGVRYSIENPDTYIQSNVIGFYNLLECCRYYTPKHLLFASSSSVYGANKKLPYSVEDMTDKPVSLYAATKKSDELFAYAYSTLYQIPVTGMRFFTVYGPWGRPDMAYYSFTKKIRNDEIIKVFNNGDMYRDFTYIDDVTEGIGLLIGALPVQDENGTAYKVYNIGNNHPINLVDFIKILEECLGKKARIEYCPMQPGDVYQTFADIEKTTQDIGFLPKTSLKDGLETFVQWYEAYYSLLK